MSQFLELPDHVLEELQHAAHASGVTPVDWIAAQLPAARESGSKGRDHVTTTVGLAARFAD